jgi:hypothetical protein
MHERLRNLLTRVCGHFRKVRHAAWPGRPCVRERHRRDRRIQYAGELDLRDIAFSSATTVSFAEAASNLSGTLTATDGVHTANITLLGQYTASQFTAASDGLGGTLINDPLPVAATDHVTAPHHT